MKTFEKRTNQVATHYGGNIEYSLYDSPFYDYRCMFNLDLYFKGFESKVDLIKYYFFLTEKEQHFKEINIRMYVSDNGNLAGRSIRVSNSTTVEDCPEIKNDIVLTTSREAVRTVQYRTYKDQIVWFFDITHNEELCKRILEIKNNNPEKTYFLEINLLKICDKSLEDIDSQFTELAEFSMNKFLYGAWCNSGFKNVSPYEMNIKEDFSLKYSINHLKLALKAYINSGSIDLFDLNSSIVTKETFPIKAMNIFLRDKEDQKTIITFIKPKFVSHKDSEYKYLFRLVNTIEEANELLEYIEDEERFDCIVVQMIPCREGKTTEELEKIEYERLKHKFEKTDCRAF